MHDDAGIGALVVGLIAEEGKAGDRGIGAVEHADRGLVGFRQGLGFAGFLAGVPTDDGLVNAGAGQADARGKQRAFGFRVFAGGHADGVGSGRCGLGGGGQGSEGGLRSQAVVRVATVGGNKAILGAGETGDSDCQGESEQIAGHDGGVLLKGIERNELGGTYWGLTGRCGAAKAWQPGGCGIFHWMGYFC